MVIIPRTEGISSTMLKEFDKKDYKMAFLSIQPATKCFLCKEVPRIDFFHIFAVEITGKYQGWLSKSYWARS